MPPKSKKKNDKKTKAEIEAERLARELEERDKRLAEEAERLRVEQEKKRLQQQACLEYRNTEVEDLVQEFDEMNDELKRFKISLEQCKKQYNDNENWLDYLDNNKRWPTLDERDLNTFVSELTDEDDDEDFTKVLEIVAFIQALIEDIGLELIWTDDPGMAKNYSTIAKFAPILRDVSRQKVWKSVLDKLVRYDDYVNKDNCFEFTAKGNNSAAKVALWKYVSKKSPKQMKAEYEHIGLVIDIPKSIVSSNALVSLCYFPLDYISNETNDSNYFIIGGTYEYNLMKPHITSKIIEDWTITCLHDDLDILPSFEPIALGGGKVGTREMSVSLHMLKCRVKLSDNIIVSKDSKIARYDEIRREWSTETLPPIKFDVEKRMLSFHMSLPGRYALISDRHIDLPYCHWSVYPVNRDEIMFEVLSPRFKFTFSINEKGCSLLTPDILELQDLINKRSKPHFVLHQLKVRGINLLPSWKDSEKCSLSTIADTLETRVYQDISLCAPSFCFKQCQESYLKSSNQVIYEVSETGIFAGRKPTDSFEPIFVLTELDHESESCINAPSSVKLPEKCGNIKINLVGANKGLFASKDTKDVSIHDVILKNTKPSLYLSNALRQVYSRESCERISMSKCIRLRYNYLYEILSLVRPLSFQSYIINKNT